MANKAKIRKREGKETKFTVGGQPWTIDRIERSARRAKLESGDVDLAGKCYTRVMPFLLISALDVNTPLGVAYGTPGKDLPSSKDVHNTAMTGRWSPYHVPYPTPLVHLQLQWDGKKKSDIDAVYERTKQLVKAGQFREAEEGYLQTLGGYEALLSPTHKDTNTVAYELADLYAQINRVGDADRVLDWMSEKHGGRWGLGHKKTRGHMVHVADLLESWARVDDAVALISRMADRYEMSAMLFPNGPGKSAVPQYYDAHSDRGEYQLPPIGKRAFALKDGNGDHVQMDYQVRLAITRAKAQDQEAEALLLRLLERCERHPNKLAVQIIEARSGLLEFYKTLGIDEKFQSGLLDIGKSFWNVFTSEAERTELLL